MSRLVLVTGLLGILASRGEAAERFPRPQFESGYRLPALTFPAPRSPAWEWTDVGVLLAALSGAAWLALRERSRRGLILLSVFSVLYFGFWRQGCICPVGSIQNVVQALADSTYRLPWTVLVFALTPLVFALLFGRVFCAAVCPLGALQDWAAIRPVRWPRSLTTVLALGPVIVLSLAVVAAGWARTYAICRTDPFVAFFRLHGPSVRLLPGALVLLLGVWVARPYCRFFCPYGLLLGWLSALSWRHVTITPDECVRCRLCEKACPFDAIRPANLDEKPPRVDWGVRRLAFLLALLPVSVGVGAWLGYRLSPLMARTHFTVRLAEEVAQAASASETPVSLEVQTFRASATPTDRLFADAAAIRRRVARAMTVAGAAVAGLVMARLIAAGLHRTRQDWEPDRQRCVSCGRCFAWCPREQARRRGQTVPVVRSPEFARSACREVPVNR